MRSKLVLLVAGITLWCLPTHAQVRDAELLAKYKIYDDDRLTSAFHRSRRDSIRASLGDDGLALFLAAPVKNRANDVDYEYHQDPNFYYLTGHIQPNAALIITRDQEIFFSDLKDPAREQWTGVRLGTEGARQLLGFSNVQPISDLHATLAQLLKEVTTLYYDPPTPKKHHEAALDTTYNIWDQTVSIIKSRYPDIEVKSFRTRLGELRMRKTPEEMYLLRKAITISNEAHNDILRQVSPGWSEYQIQALGEYVFKKNGCEYTGYPCIVGAGNNGAVLHYITNRAQTKDGDMVVMDIGGEYHGYTADVTRSFPVNGRFTPEQRTIYNLVLEAQDSGIALCRAGQPFRAAHFAAVRVIQKGLLRLGIIKDTAQFRQYFMHGTSHYLGLDVHDPGTFGLLEPGVVMTVEPGIYIPEGSPCDKKWWSISCRIEDDILITTGDPEILSIASPRTAQDVEQMMGAAQSTSQETALPTQDLLAPDSRGKAPTAAAPKVKDEQKSNDVFTAPAGR
jgi:Xaa-Pro aminopeptidase